jgi:hypothetical protein
VPAVRVSAELESWKSASLTLVAPVTSTTTDADGRFELRDLPAGDTHIAISGPQVIERHWPLADLPVDAEADLQALRRCRFRLDLASPSDADRLQVLDSEGRVLELWQTRGAVTRTGDGWSVTSGTSPVLEVSETAATVVLLEAGVPSLRIPVRFDPDETARVR